MLIALSLCAWGNDSQAAETAPAKLAIVDVGTREPVRPGFVELVMAAVSSDPGVVLLEREEIKRLLREQTLALSVRGAVESQAAVKAGQVWGADAFLMLEAQSNGVLSVRLVDTRYGVVLWNSAFALGPTANELTQQAEVIATRTQQKLPLLQRNFESICAVSVAAIRCEEISRRFDWMAERLATGIEQQLGALPGMLLERRSTRSLTEERSLVNGLPESLRAAVMLVEGDFKISRAQDVDTVTLTIRGRRGRAIVFEERVTGIVKDIDQLCRQAAQIIAKKAGVAVATAPMNPAREAQMLITEAGGCVRVGEPMRALGLVEAAYALQPQDYTNAVLVLELLALTSGPIQSNEAATLAAADHGLAVVDRLLCDPAYVQPKIPSQMSDVDYQINYALLRYASAWTCRADATIWDAGCAVILGGGLAGFSVIPSPGCGECQLVWGGATTKWICRVDAAAELNATFWDVFARAGELERRHGTRAYALFVELERRLAGVQRTPEAALRQTGAAWKDAVAFFETIPNETFNNWQLLVPTSPFAGERWKAIPGLEHPYLDFLEEKSKDQDPLLRFGAELALLEVFAGRSGPKVETIPDVAKAAAHLEKFTAILETYLIPHYGSLRIAHDVLGKIAPGPLNLRFATEPAEDQAIKLRFGCRLTEAALKSGQGVAAYAFLPVTMYMVQRLQQAGQTDRAVDYLSRTLALCGDMPYQEIINAKELLDRLQPGHPLAVGARLEVLQPPAKMRICLSLSSAGSDWLAKEHAQFERIYRTETGWVVLFSTGSQIGILELTPQFTAIREQHLKFTQPTSMRQSANPNDHGFKHWLFNRPVLTTDGDEVFVGFIDGAIIRFVSGMPPLRLRDTGGLSSQLIEHLAVLNHRLYAIVDSGGDDQNALEEIDTVTGASTILLSSRTKVPKNVIDGRPLRGLLADPAHHCLWLLVGSIYVPGNPNNQLVISEYDPMSGSVCLKDIPKLNECFFGDKIGTYLAHSDNVILMGGLVACKRLDTEANILSTTIVEGSDLSRRSPPITVGSNLIGVHKNQLIYYKADVCEPFYALDSGLTFATPPPKRRRPRLVIDGGVLCEALHGTKIRDLFSLGKDFLFLTDDAMWLVEMPTAIDGRPLESAAQSQ